MRSSARSWADHLSHPLPLAAVVVLLVNDHLLKGSGLLPSVVTGKLSDAAGLFFFPLLLASLFRGARALVGRGAEGSPAIAAAAALSTAAVFTALKLWPAFNALVEQAIGRNVLDPTDLFALPAVLASWLWMRREAPPTPLPALAQLAAVTVAGLASLATSSPKPTQLTDQPITLTREVSCADVKATWQGLGVPGLSFSTTLAAKTSPCGLELVQAELYVGTRVVRGSISTGLKAVPSAGVIDFPVDLEQLANEPKQSAAVVLMFGGSESNRASWDITLPTHK